MGLDKVYPCTEFEVSIFTRSRFTEGGLKFKIHFVIREMGRDKIYACTNFEVSSFTSSKDTAHVPLNGWMRDGVCPQTRAWISVVFTGPPPNLASI